MHDVTSTDFPLNFRLHLKEVYEWKFSDSLASDYVQVLAYKDTEYSRTFPSVFVQLQRCVRWQQKHFSRKTRMFFCIFPSFSRQQNKKTPKYLITSYSEESHHPAEPLTASFFKVKVTDKEICYARNKWVGWNFTTAYEANKEVIALLIPIWINWKQQNNFINQLAVNNYGLNCWLHVTLGFVLFRVFN